MEQLSVYNQASMWSRRRDTEDRLTALTSDIVVRLQRLERAHREIRATLEGERQLRIFFANLISAGQTAPVIGAAIERFAKAMRAPIPCGRAGGLARARHAWRYLDGTFMPESERCEARRQEYERYAAGGRARAASALRAKDGAFLPAPENPEITMRIRR
jgi:hypothetical protein